MTDVLHFSRKLPTVPMQRRMRLSDVAEARAKWPNRISWCTIFLKAYSIVSERTPELRRTYMPLPWGHLYEHPTNIATFTVERDYQGENAVFWAQVPRPEIFDLASLDQFVRRHRTAPLDSVASFQRGLRLSRYPWPMRRLLWAAGLYFGGAARAQLFGTFGISVVASLGAAGLHLLSPLTTTLNYSPFEMDGTIDVRLTYDHRVLDGAPVARAMADLENVLHEEIADELHEGPLTPDPSAWSAQPADADDYVTAQVG